MSTLPESVYTAHPDVVTQAIKFLCWVVIALGGILSTLAAGFIGTLIYIWNKADARVERIETKIGNVAESIENMDKTVTTELAGIKLRCALLHADDPRAHIRASDLSQNSVQLR